MRATTARSTFSWATPAASGFWATAGSAANASPAAAANIHFLAFIRVLWPNPVKVKVKVKVEAKRLRPGGRGLLGRRLARHHVVAVGELPDGGGDDHGRLLQVVHGEALVGIHVGV